ncbi:DUF4358 domain-containing protein [Brevibacillus sp. FSL K6-0770]|uniref:DUF4358 domain-containing protein n=1 Tax=Brevibacillus sp. FSL K6-0770 TaxID=2954673 RepID=UPI0030FB6A50
MTSLFGSKGARKWLAALFACAALVMATAGCSDAEREEAAPTIEEIAEHISQAVNVSELKQGDAAKLQKLYHIAPEEIEGFMLLTSQSNVRADEILVLQVKDAADLGAIKENVQKRIKAQLVKFSDYRPDEATLVEEHVWKTKDRFALFAVSRESGQVEQAFEEAFSLP